MFDFNNDGHTDTGEHYTGYQIFQDVTGKGSNGSSGGSGTRLSGVDIFLIILFIYAILNLFVR